MDLATTRCDVGTVRLLRERDEWGESFEFELNGRKVWARGANWIPDDNFPSRITKAKLRAGLERCKAMGFNMLRVWGGGLYETDEFYDLCDELGLLVWQDFPFACAYYPDDEVAQAVVRAEAAENVRRLRNHPCLALWCGNNENHEMFSNGWAPPERTPDRYYGERLYDGTLPEVVDDLDAGRSYIPSSPIGTPPDERPEDAKRRGPNADLWGDQHNWDVWHGRGDWRHYTDSKGRFSSEYGFAAACGLPRVAGGGRDARRPLPLARRAVARQDGQGIRDLRRLRGASLSALGDDRGLDVLLATEPARRPPVRRRALSPLALLSRIADLAGERLLARAELGHGGQSGAPEGAGLRGDAPPRGPRRPDRSRRGYGASLHLQRR